MNRKEFFMTSGAAIAGAAMAPQLLAAKSPSKEDWNETRKSLSHKFRLEKDGEVAVDNKGGFIRVEKKANFPILQGLTMYSVHMLKGGLREPHWHPNCHEINYVIQGRARVGIHTAGGGTEVVELEAGDTSYIPMGYIHYIENIADGDTNIIVAFNHESPEDVGISDALGSVPNSLLEKTFGVGPKTFDSLPKPEKHFLLVPR